jgi:hypothetical protein
MKWEKGLRAVVEYFIEVGKMLLIVAGVVTAVGLVGYFMGVLFRP